MNKCMDSGARLNVAPAVTANVESESADTVSSVTVSDDTASLKDEMKEERSEAKVDDFHLPEGAVKPAHDDGHKDPG